MASLASYYDQNSDAAAALPLTLASNQLQEGNAREDAALAKTRLGTNYGRDLTNLVNRYSARGTVRGGHAGVAADEQRADYDWNTADVDRGLSRYLYDSGIRSRTLSTMGVII